MPDYIKTDGTVRFETTYWPATQTDAATKEYVDLVFSNAAMGEEVVPMEWNFASLPAGTVGQPTQQILDILGTAPFFVDIVIPAAYTGYIVLKQLPGGSIRFEGTPPSFGATAAVNVPLTFIGWNADPTTDADHPIELSFDWVVNPSITDVAWVTPSALPDGEVGVAYSVHATVTGTGPVTFARQAGMTTAALTAAGLNFTAGAIADLTVAPFLSGVPLPGSEGTLGSSVTVRATGLSGTPDDQVFASGITIRRPPGISITAIPVITTAAGSIDLGQYLIGFPVCSITRDASSVAYPTGFSDASDTLSWTGLTDAGNGTTEIVFVISNGYHDDVLVTFAIQRNVPAAASIDTDVVTGTQKSSASSATTTVSHAAASSGIKGVFMAACTSTGSGLDIDLASCSYGGVSFPVAMTQTGSTRSVAVGFLGSGVPQGTQNAVFTWDAATTAQHQVLVITVTATGDLEIADTDGLNSTGANTSQQSVLSGALSRIFAFGGISVAATTDITDPAGVTRIRNIDQGTSCWIAWEKDDNTSSDYTFTLTHASVARAFIQMAIRAVSNQGLTGASRSWSQNGLANGGAQFSSLANNTEITDLADLLSGQAVLTEAQGTSAAHEGPRVNSANQYAAFLDGTSGTLASMGATPITIGVPPWWIAFDINVSDTQVAGDRCFLATGGSNLYLNRTGSNSIAFKIKSGAATVTATAVDAVTNVVRILFGVIDADTAYIAYATTGGTFTYDTGDITAAGIGLSFSTFILNPSSLGPANVNLQAIAWGSGLANKAVISAWLNSQSDPITPPPPPPSVTAFRRADAFRWFSPELAFTAYDDALRTGFSPPHGLNMNSPAAQGLVGNNLLMGDGTIPTTELKDTSGNTIIARNFTLNGKPAFRHEIRKAWPTWFAGDNTMRSRLLTAENLTTTYGIRRNTKTYWHAYSFRISSESDTSPTSPWPPGINQLIIDWKQPTAMVQTHGKSFNSMPRLELQPTGVLRLQRLNLNAGQTIIADDGSNCSPLTVWQQQLVADTWYDVVLKVRMAGRAANGPILQMWLSVNGGQQTEVLAADTNPNSYEYLASPYTFMVYGIYDWDSTRGTWVKQVMYSGRAIVAEDGVGTPPPSAENMLAALLEVRA